MKWFWCRQIRESKSYKIFNFSWKLSRKSHRSAKFNTSVNDFDPANGFLFKIDRLHGHVSTLLNGTIFFQMVFGSIITSSSLYIVHLVTYATLIFCRSFPDLFCSTLALALPGDASNFQCFQSSNEFDSDLLVGIMAVFISISIILPYCYYSSNTAYRLESVANDIYDSLWYRLPVRLEKFYILSIASAQSPRYFTGFSMISCSLGTFTKVLHIHLGLLCTYFN